MSLERLSSGLRINRASDDAASLAISETLRGQVRGDAQAIKNVQDGINLIRTADGGLNEIHAILQRCRELAVQAGNDTYAAADRADIQAEFNQLLAEIDKTALNTTWNGIKVLGGSTFTAADYAAVTNALQNSLLGDAYAVVQNTWGIPVVGPNTRPIDIYLDEVSAGGTLAYVSGFGSFSPSLELHVDMYDFVPNAGLGSPPFLNDRILAHEFTHAVMFDSTAFSSFPTWFQEGTAEFTHGADERVQGDLAAMGGDTPANRAALLGRISAGGWGGQSADYSAAYTSMRYLDAQLRAAGQPNGLRTATATYIANNPAATMDGLVALAGYANQAAFIADLQGGNGLAWMNANMSAANLADADTGSVTGKDYGGPVKDFNGVVPNGTAGDPTPWIETFQPQAAAGPVIIQQGADQGQVDTIGLVNVTQASLGLNTLSLTNNTGAGAAIAALDAAISTISTYRAAFAVHENRLEHAAQNLMVGRENQAAAESRMRDADLPQTMSDMTRQQIMVQSSTAMLAQANSKSFMVMLLLQ
ncbi:MAG: flagellin/flagellar hook associated protein [Cyanobacteria bacterium RYN_339]|nr:flagellin/flagellar hook associated protein [Cyanobacteria bacterium RYN_339]